MTTNFQVSASVTWGDPITAPIKYDDLQRTIDSVQAGIEQARRGEGRVLQEKDLPVDDD